MNIFVLDYNPEIAASMHSDKHVVKMIVETVQLLSTAHRLLDGVESVELVKGRRLRRWLFNASDSQKESLYKATHMNHPCAVWARQSKQNYAWLYNMFLALCSEYSRRYGKIHKSESLKEILVQYPKRMTSDALTPFALAMPEKYKSSDAVQSYREYYKNDKKHLLKYKTGYTPHWL